MKSKATDSIKAALMRNKMGESVPVETQQKIKEVIEPALMKTRIDSAAISPAVQELIQQALQPVNQQLEAAVAQKQTAAVAASTRLIELEAAAAEKQAAANRQLVACKAELTAAQNEQQQLRSQCLLHVHELDEERRLNERLREQLDTNHVRYTAYDTLCSVAASSAATGSALPLAPCTDHCCHRLATAAAVITTYLSK